MSSEIGRRDDKVLLVNRIVYAILWVLVLPPAVRLLVIPEQTAEYFAWPLKPRMSAMFQGSLFVTVLYVFAYLVFARKWHRTAPIVWAVVPVITMLGVATLLHIDKFTGPRDAFYIWYAVYIYLPPAALVLLLLNHLRDPKTPEAIDAALPMTVRVASAALAVMFLSIATALFLAPQQMISVWPWQMQPLAARALGSDLLAPAVVHLCAVLDHRWTSLRKVTQGAFIWVVVVMVSVIRCWDEFDKSRPLTWMLIAATGLELAFVVWTYTTMERELRAKRAMR